MPDWPNKLQRHCGCQLWRCVWHRSSALARTTCSTSLGRTRTALPHGCRRERQTAHALVTHLITSTVPEPACACVGKTRFASCALYTPQLQNARWVRFALLIVLYYWRSYLLKAVGLGFPIFHGTGMMVASVGLLPYQAVPTPLLSHPHPYCSLGQRLAEAFDVAGAHPCGGGSAHSGAKAAGQH